MSLSSFFCASVRAVGRLPPSFWARAGDTGSVANTNSRAMITVKARMGASRVRRLGVPSLLPHGAARRKGDNMHRQACRSMRLTRSEPVEKWRKFARRANACAGRLAGTGRTARFAQGGQRMTDSPNGAAPAGPRPSARAVVAFGVAASMAAGALAILPAGAQAPYPQRPVMLIVPYGAGGIADTGMRIVADKLGA